MNNTITISMTSGVWFLAWGLVSLQRGHKINQMGQEMIHRIQKMEKHRNIY